MHDTRFVQEIFSVLKEQAAKNQGHKAVAVTVRLSPLSHVTSDGLRATYKTLSRGGAYENVRVQVEPLPLRVSCERCKKISQVTARVFACPSCGSDDIEMRFDKEFFVESVEFESEDGHD
jgi:hydrogenase nickel insertion protein HypA